jgi:probable phosphoglycerate mutase
MDRGMGRAPAASPAPAPAQTAPAPNKGVMLRGLVKNGVVHVLGGQLPDGTFVKVIPE